ncbi:MAG: UDP-N-acetylmuramate dehydrogenase [Colwellia sp.]|nr:UDP-N-acetylmuramate dehydrogenase [Colwellia sp.]
MESSQQFSLQNNNSFNVKAICPTIYFPKSLTDLKQLPDLASENFYILGDGTNTLFIDQQAPTIIKPSFTGVDITETADSYIVTVGAGENWHQLVSSLLEQGIFGLENLALIPGSVGAAPVQNIGAYGVEFSNFCIQVKWFEFVSKTVNTLNNDGCQFTYRNSVFKHALYNKGIIIEVVFSFPKVWQANLSYAGLNELNENATAKAVMEKVISLRQAKLPDPQLLPNAGSFFKNPIVDETIFTRLQREYPKMPFYPQGKKQVKLAAGWLIEQAGLKGYCENGVGVHEKQALVLVNYESENGQDIVALAHFVQQQVLAKFDIIISPEVRMLTSQGEQDFADLVIK